MNSEIETQIYVQVFADTYPMWRPVPATKISENIYLLGGENLDWESEHWEFPPGSCVEVQQREFAARMQGGNKGLVAIRLHDCPESV